MADYDEFDGLLRDDDIKVEEFERDAPQDDDVSTPSGAGDEAASSNEPIRLEELSAVLPVSNNYAMPAWYFEEQSRRKDIVKACFVALSVDILKRQNGTGSVKDVSTVLRSRYKLSSEVFYTALKHCLQRSNCFQRKECRRVSVRSMYTYTIMPSACNRMIERLGARRYELDPKQIDLDQEAGRPSAEPISLDECARIVIERCAAILEQSGSKSKRQRLSPTPPSSQHSISQPQLATTSNGYHEAAPTPNESLRTLLAAAASQPVEPTRRITESPYEHIARLEYELEMLRAQLENCQTLPANDMTFCPSTGRLEVKVGGSSRVRHIISTTSNMRIAMSGGAREAVGARLLSDSAAWTEQWSSDRRQIALELDTPDDIRRLLA